LTVDRQVSGGQLKIWLALVMTGLAGGYVIKNSAESRRWRDGGNRGASPFIQLA
jgi:hypothetical protein